MSDKFISASEIRELLGIAPDGDCEKCRFRGMFGCQQSRDFVRVCEAIDDCSTADVQPVVRARWYWDAYKYDWCCGNCFHPADHYIDKDNVYKSRLSKFCPHCGANMLEVEMDDRIN